MLPREHRMVHPGDFKNTIRRGSRAGNSMVVVHCRTDEASECALVGFVVPKKVIRLATGRNRIKRQLRHLMRERLADLSPHMHVVIRVLPGAVGQDFHVLAAQLDNALGRALRKVARKQQGHLDLDRLALPSSSQILPQVPMLTGYAEPEASTQAAGEIAR